MKRFLALLGILSVLGTSAPAFVFAKATSTPAGLSAAKERVTKVRETLIRAYFERMAKRIEAAIGREKKLAERVESRIKKFEEAGKNVAQARAKLEEARKAVAEAEAALNEAKAKFEQALAKEDVKVAFRDVRSLVKQVVAKVKAGHQSIVSVIRSLKGASQTP
ncbi:hypothetical protein HYW30_00230 [Candidatus Azambacteria bacterium]|nr:hypothetical protein [Candidatus Azambacteria bacterium]MBI2587718.1 hypothetical protein [Candidatus Azambacteria bacterium]